MLARKTHGIDDSLLLSQMKAGDRLAFDTLYEKYKTDVINEAYKRLGDTELAKDVTQDVFTALWIKRADHVIENLPGYLYITVKNNVLRIIQRQDKFVPIPDLLNELQGNTEHADAKILYDELFKAYEALVASLPDQQRIIYEMRYKDNLSPDEIAKKLNISPKTVRNHLGKALARLRTTFMLVHLLIWIADKH